MHKYLDRVKIELRWLIDKTEVWVPGSVVTQAGKLVWVPDGNSPDTWDCLIEYCDPAKIRTPPVGREVKTTSPKVRVEKPFEIGDRVWSLNYGWGSVAIAPEDLESEEYPLYVNFDSGTSEQYTSEGYLWTACETPSLFHANQGVLEFNTNEPVVIAENQPIWVRDSEADEWVPRHFARYAGPGVYCYPDGKSKHGTGEDEPCEYWEFFRTSAPESSDG